MCRGDAVMTYTELRASGVGRRRLAALVSNGRLLRVRRGFYARPEACTDVLTATRHGGELACTTAARHLGLWVLESSDRVHVALGGHGHAYQHDGCRCIEHWDDAALLPEQAGSAIVPRLLRQIWRCRGIEDFFVALESALRQGRITRAGVAWLRASCGGEAGEAIAFARRDADSGLESLFRWRLRGRGIRIRTQVTITSVGRVDFLIGERLIVEIDGTGNHDGASNRHRDLVRDAQAAAWGYVTLRFDYAQVVHDWDAVLSAVLAHLDRDLHLA